MEGREIVEVSGEVEARKGAGGGGQLCYGIEMFLYKVSSRCCW